LNIEFEKDQIKQQDSLIFYFLLPLSRNPLSKNQKSL
jgi:hypothetical protein